MSDLIRRQAVFDMLAEMQGRCTSKTALIQNSKIWQQIKDMPSAQPERCEDCVNFSKTRLLIPQPELKWIPTSEKLPDELDEVNVTWENTEPEPYYDFVKGHCFTGTAIYFRGRWYWYSAVCVDYLKEYGFSPNDEMDDAIKVLAWMPLPKPWKGEEE